ncbi:MAG: flavin reductase family protein [Deltaproteobacteria bacterium]|jgi:flavin reductase (DIM6/NTAB) family NADH-FMN oxidoreductase RutF|nr:flavin reductase family protein [Deltaproteobacteria bacterium]MBW2481467.1 flavin reductase family protein [Deltaproteobacteria bacterium]
MKRSIGAKTLVYPTPVFVVGTYDKDGKPNVMTAAWGGICCSKPPCVAVSLRKTRYSFDNIIARKAFTINIAPEKYVKESDYFGIVSGRNKDKLAAAGLTPVKSDLVDAPFIEEFPFALECRLLDRIEIGVHIQFIGEIVDIKADEAVLNDNGIPDIESAKPILYAPEINAYYGVGKFLGKAFSIGKEI